MLGMFVNSTQETYLGMTCLVSKTSCQTIPCVACIVCMDVLCKTYLYFMSSSFVQYTRMICVDSQRATWLVRYSGFINTIVSEKVIKELFALIDVEQQKG